MIIGQRQEEWKCSHVLFLHLIVTSLKTSEHKILWQRGIKEAYAQEHHICFVQTLKPNGL
jgi:hypothetical protein